MMMPIQMTIARLDGRVSTENRQESELIESRLTGFLNSMNDEGYDTSRIIFGSDMISEEVYVSRLGEQLLKAQSDSDLELRQLRGGSASTRRLYRVARSFLSFML